MTALELLVFSALAVLTNTVFPVPFEPVLLAYSGGAAERAWPLALVGSACAGVAAVIDARLMRVVQGGLDPHSRWVPLRAGVRFHAVVFACALLPLPFVLVRASLLRARPRLAGYAAVVAAGRLPRYLLTLWAGSQVLPGSWSVTTAVAGVFATSLLAVGVWRVRTQAGAGIPR